VSCLIKASIGYLWRHPWQGVLAILGIAIGVAVIVAVDLANASSRLAFLQSLDAVTGRATHQVVGGPTGVRESLYSGLRRDHGVDEIAPVIEAGAGVGEGSFTLLGVDLFAEQGLRDYRFAAGSDGQDVPAVFTAFLTEPGSVVLSSQTARDLGIVPGDRFDVRIRGRDYSALLVATFDDGGSLAAYILTDIATAQEWLNEPDSLTRLDVRLDEGEITAFESLLPPDVRLLEAEGRTQATLDMSNAFMVNLNAMSLLALLVGLFLIYNSTSFSVLQRRHLLGVLRALGVTRLQAFALIVTEAALFGLVAGALGLAIGIWLGEQLLFFVTRSINDLYFRVAVTSVSVEPTTLVKGMAAGLLAAIVAAAIPALEAASTAPRLAMARSNLETGASHLVPRIALAGVGLVLGAGATLILSETSLLAGLVSIFLLIFGCALATPWFVRMLSQWLAPLAGRLGGVAARLAVTGIGTSLSRTGVAIVALAVAVSATIGVSIMVDSFRGSVDNWLTRTLEADVYLGLPAGGVDRDLADAIVSLPDVAAFSTSRRVLLATDNRETRVRAIRMAPGGYSGTELLDADPAVAWPRWETEDVVFVSEPFAYRNGIQQGDRLVLPADRGNTGFEVAGTFQSYDINGSGVLMSRATYDRHWNDPSVDSLGLYLETGTDVDEAIAAVSALGDSHGQALFVNSNVDIRELSLSIFDRTFIVTNILYWLAVAVAIVGILGAMLALQLERSRELGLLRALGMTPRDLGGNIVFQTGTIGAIAGLVAIPLGLAMAWVLIEVINRRAFGWQIDVDVSPGYVLAGLAIAIGSALVAGAYPAWRAAHTEPALAMREE
jgi:putative ABC transport system permease protein